jgi:hypothetical protein
METPDPFLERVASVLAAVPGVVAIALGCGDELRNWGIERSRYHGGAVKGGGRVMA